MTLGPVIDSPFSETAKARLHSEIRTTDFRGEMYTYEHINYRCDETGIEFNTDETSNESTFSIVLNTISRRRKS